MVSKGGDGEGYPSMRSGERRKLLQRLGVRARAPAKTFFVHFYRVFSGPFEGLDPSGYAIEAHGRTSKLA